MKRFGTVLSLSLVLIVVVAGTVAWACDAQKALASNSKEKCAFKSARHAKLMEDAKEVELVGRVLCASCDLKTGEGHCSLVFRVDGDEETVYTLVRNDVLTVLAEETSHGEKLVKVTGKAAADGDLRLLSVEAFQTRG